VVDRLTGELLLVARRGRCRGRGPAESWRFSGGRDSETGNGARDPMGRPLGMLVFRVGRRVRISFAPAASLQTIGPPDGAILYVTRTRMPTGTPPCNDTESLYQRVRAKSDGVPVRCRFTRNSFARGAASGQARGRWRGLPLIVVLLWASPARSVPPVSFLRGGELSLTCQPRPASS
jgi:hypothetical protein